jgi:hypothetical protein
MNAPLRFGAAIWHKVRRFLLRGRLLEVWLSRSTRLLGQAYELFVASFFTRSLPPEAEVKSKSVAPPINSLLFVCCNMWEQRELLPELQKLARITFVDLAQCYRSAAECKSVFREDAWQRVLAGLPKDGRYDAAVVYLDGHRLQESVLDWVRSVTAGPVFGLNLDDKTTYAEFPVFRREAQGYRKWAGRFDFNLTNSRAFVDIYRSDGYRCLYLPTGYHYDPSRHFAPSAPVYLRPLAFVGSRKPERAAFVERLQQLGVPVKAYGAGWPGGQFTNDGAEVYRSTQINLGIGYNLPGDQFTNLKNRDFECPGSGGCYLTTFDWELAELFDVGREILCYRTVADFCEIYLYYSRRPEECWKIACAGFERARKEHTWAHRFAEVFRQGGLRLSWNG